MSQLVAVDHDPFAGPSVDLPTIASAQTKPLEITVGAPKLVPVQHDPFETGRFDDAFTPTNSRPDLKSALDVAAANRNPRGAAIDPALQGLTLGFSDELVGLIGGVSNAMHGKSFGEGYSKYSDAARANLENYHKRHPWLSTAAEVAGSLPTALVPMGTAARGATLLAKMGWGALAGAGVGGLYGAGAADDGVANRLVGAGAGAGTGALLGATVPAVTTAAKVVGKPIIDAALARFKPGAYAAQKIAERAAPRGGVDAIANRIERAAQAGQNMSVVDVGGRGVQRLARTLANAPGGAGDRIAAKNNISAMAQGDRLKRAVSDVFDAPEGAYQAAKATVMDARSNAAKPFYDEAYATPIPYTFDLEKVLQTPAGKAGLAAAKQNSANRREPWAQWFASVDDAGNIIDKRRVPDTRALDEVQRVIRRMTEEAKAPADGSPFAKAKATPKSDAIGSVHRDLLNIMDEHNPAFAKARSVGMDNIQADEALEFGRNALNTDSRVIAQRMGDAGAYGRDRVLSDGQKELARIGLAEAIRDKIDKAGMTHDALRKFFATTEQRARLRPFFSSQKDYFDFSRQMINEARKRKAIDMVRGNSTTAAQLADMADADQMGHVAQAGSEIAKGNFVKAGTQLLVRGIRRLGGLTPEVANRMATMLTTSDPMTVRAIIGTLKQIEASTQNATFRKARIRAFLTEMVAGQAGHLLAPQSNGQMVAQ